MRSREEVVQLLKAKKPDLQKRYPIAELALFGSYARDDYNENSDIDILVSFNHPIGIEFITLAHELEDLLQTKIDLVSRNGIQPRYLSFVEKNLIHV